MNNLVVDEVEFVAKDFNGQMKVLPKDFCLRCQGKNKITLQMEEDVCLKIVLFDESSLDIYLDMQNLGYKRVEIEQHNNTNLHFRSAFSSCEDVCLEIIDAIKGNHNHSQIQIRNISYDSFVKISVLAVVAENTVDNEIVEDLKGIECGGKIEIKPDMQIYTNEVMANHFVTIGTVSADELFYLESKGLSKDVATKLILDGFINSLKK